MSTLQFDEIKQRQRSQWDASAPGWKKWERKFIHNLQPLTDLLVRNAGIRTGYSVLDLACGTGRTGTKHREDYRTPRKSRWTRSGPWKDSGSEREDGDSGIEERHVPA